MDTTVDRENREHERMLAIAPYIERLEDQCAGWSPGGKRPPELSGSLDLNPWELQALHRGLEADPGEHGDWERLLAEGVALQARYVDDLALLEQDVALTPEELDVAHAPLLRTAAVGIALLEELQRVIDAMILGGKMGEAKRLSSFRGKLSSSVAEIRDRVGDQAFAEAETTAAEMIAPVAEHPARRPSLEELDEEPPRQIRLDRHAGKVSGFEVVDPPRDRIKPLLTIFALAFVAWLVLVLPRAWKTEIPALEAREVTTSPVVEQVLVRPPSLFLIVDEAAWSAMPVESREALVRQVGGKAESNGYTGVNVRTGDGTTVGQWTRARGIRLIAGGDAGT